MADVTSSYNSDDPKCFNTQCTTKPGLESRPCTDGTPSPTALAMVYGTLELDHRKNERKRPGPTNLIFWSITLTCEGEYTDFHGRLLASDVQLAGYKEVAVVLGCTRVRVRGLDIFMQKFRTHHPHERSLTFVRYVDIIVDQGRPFMETVFKGRLQHLLTG
ncbi:hypothetical protein TNCV_312091 [Trichonephila clavipes]|nr:hypothetical protein TNCV_312091 [Trichonephila clavipes]